jgi:hypothetical protein
MQHFCDCLQHCHNISPDDVLKPKKVRNISNTPFHQIKYGYVKMAA